MTTNGTDDGEIKAMIRYLRDLLDDPARESGAMQALITIFGWERVMRLWNEEAKERGR